MTDRDPHNDPAYWRMVRENHDAIFSEQDRRDRAKKRRLALWILLIMGTLAAVGYVFGPL